MTSSLCKVTSVFALVLLLLKFSTSMKIQHECKGDADCQNGAINALYYCDNSFCEPCIPCGERFKREPPTGSGCARIEDDCGSCLPGYQAEDWVNQRRSWYCIKSVASSAEEMMAPPESNETWNIVLLAVIGLFVAVAVIVVLVHFCKRPIVTRPNTAKLEEYQLVPTSPSAPPPPYYTVGNNVDELDNATRSVVRQPFELSLERDNLVRATPFQPARICPLEHQDQDQLDEDAILLMVHAGLNRQPSLDSYSNASTGNIASTEYLEENGDSTVSLNREVAIVLPPTESAVTRSFSLELLNLHRPSLSSYNSQSDPCLALQERRRRNSTSGESYSYRRIQLSNHRIPSQSIESLAANQPSSQTESSSTLAEDSHIPQPFEYISVDESNRHLQLDESHAEGLPYQARVQLIRMHSSSSPDEENQHGSADSGFQEVEFGFSLSIKRRRKD